MAKQFMVRIMRYPDEDYADVVVDAEDKEDAKNAALLIVKARPDDWFGPPETPTYDVDNTHEVEQLDSGEYQSAKRVDG